MVQKVFFGAHGAGLVGTSFPIIGPSFKSLAHSSSRELELKLQTTNNNNNN